MYVLSLALYVKMSALFETANNAANYVHAHVCGAKASFYLRP
jgi:hypothetical protein